MSTYRVTFEDAEHWRWSTEVMAEYGEAAVVQARLALADAFTPKGLATRFRRTVARKWHLHRLEVIA